MEKNTSPRLTSTMGRKRNRTTEQSTNPYGETSSVYPLHKLSPKPGVNLKTDDIEIEAPTPQGKPQKFDWISVVFQPLGALAAIIALLVILHLTGAGMSMGLYMLIGGITGMLGILWGVIRYHKQKKEQIQCVELDERQYRDYLREKETFIESCVNEQLQAMEAETPPVYKCVRYTNSSPELWSNPFNSKYFLKIRIGSGTVDFYRRIRAPEKKYYDESPLLDEARALQKKYEHIHNAPVCCNLRESPSLGIIGDRKAVISQAQEIIIAFTALHNYEDLKLMIAYPQAEKGIWEEMRFLPHVFDSQRQSRFIANNKNDATSLFNFVIDQKKARIAAATETYYSAASYTYPHILLIVAEMAYFNGSSLLGQLAVDNPAISVSCVYLAERIEQLPHTCQTIIEVQDENTSLLYKRDARNEAITYVPDTFQESAWTKYLRKLSPVRLENPSAGTDIPKSVSYLETRELSTTEDILMSWKNSHPEKSMSVLLGMMRDNAKFYFDIHPSYSGAHGIFVGTNGSGKTSIVRSWILSMASKFSPQTVSFVLVDFKSPGLFYGLERLPHFAGKISNLDIGNTGRNLVALRSEIQHREELFDETGVHDYYDYLRCHYSDHPSLPPEIPFLFIVVDELNEFKMWCNDASVGEDGMKLLDRLYQTGRALGIHIIAGSQTTGPFTDVMEKNARFRWCLKTATPDDSIFLLKTDDAFRITQKGRTIVRVGNNEIYEEIQPIFSDGPFYGEEERKQHPEWEMALISPTGGRVTVSRESERRKSELDIVVDHIAEIADTYHVPHPLKVWPDQLPTLLTLDGVYADTVADYTAVVGLVDDPALQAQYPCVIDLEKDKSVLIYGTGQTGKTQFLKTFLFSLLKNTPEEKLEVYIIESASGEFESFHDYPHVKEITDSDSGSALIKHVETLLNVRLKRRASSKDTHIVLAIDNLNTIMADNKQAIRNLVQKGPGKRIHLIASALNASDSISTIQNDIGRGFCYWISPNAYDYRELVKDKAVDSIPPMNIPGRGLGRTEHLVTFQTAMVAEDAVRDYARKRWGEKKRDQTPAPEGPGEAFVVRLGKSMSAFGQVTQDFSKNASLLIVGDDPEQRAKIMESILRQLVANTEYLEIAGIDMDASVLNQFTRSRRLRSGAETDQYLENMSGELRKRSENTGQKYPPYIIFTDDICTCLRNATSISQNRIDKNVLLNAGRFSIFFVGGCTTAEYADLYEEDEREIANAGGSGKEVVPFRRLCAGRCLLLDCVPDEIHHSLKERYTFPNEGNYYLASGKAEEIRI